MPVPRAPRVATDAITCQDRESSAGIGAPSTGATSARAAQATSSCTVDMPMPDSGRCDRNLRVYGMAKP